MQHRAEAWLGRVQKRLAESRFDLFITADQNLRYQQHLRGFRIAVLELSTNDVRRLHAAASEIRFAVGSMQPGEFRQLAIS